jgi:hypothetical protein
MGGGLERGIKAGLASRVEGKLFGKSIRFVLK